MSRARALRRADPGPLGREAGLPAQAGAAAHQEEGDRGGEEEPSGGGLGLRLRLRGRLRLAEPPQDHLQTQRRVIF